MVTATLVIGDGGLGPSLLIEAWRQAAPVDQAWAVLKDGVQRLLPRDPLPAVPRAASPREGLWRPASRPAESNPEAPWLETFSACLCCSGRTVLAAGLRRLLRRGPWGHVLIELSASGDPAVFIDLLRTPELASAVRLMGVVAVLDAKTLNEARAARLAERIASADQLWVRMADECATDVAAGAQALLSPHLDLEIPIGLWCSERFPPAPMAKASTKAPGLEARVPGSWRWSAPPEQMFDRRRLTACLESAERARVVEIERAVFRTEREWYVWQWTTGLTAADDGWRSTRHRSASRIDLRIADPARGLDSVEALHVFTRSVEACRIQAS